MEEDKNVHTLKSLYEISIKTRNFEINQLIQRNNFFMLFQGVLLAAVMQTEASKPFVEVVICLIGVMISVYQLQMSSGAKYWQEWWESRVEFFEEQLCLNLQQVENRETHQLFTVSTKEVNKTVRDRLLSSKSRSITNACILGGFSVGRAPIKVSLFLLLAWTLLLLSSVNFESLQMLEFKTIIEGFHFS